MRVPATLRDLAGGQATPTLVLPEHGRVADLLDALAAAHPALERRIRDEAGVLRPHVNLFIGQDNVRSLEGIDSILHDGDELTILAAISGGWDLIEINEPNPNQAEERHHARPESVADDPHRTKGVAGRSRAARSRTVGHAVAVPRVVGA